MDFPSSVNIDANLTINFLSYVNMVFSMLTFNIIIINTIQTHNTFLLGTTNIVTNNKHGYKPQTYMFIYVYIYLCQLNNIFYFWVNIFHRFVKKD